MDALRIPILKIGATLITSIQTELHDASAVQFKDDLLERIHTTRARGVVIDLTAVDVVDSFIGRLISDIGAMCGLMGAQVVLTGLQPAVAITLVELGLELPRVHTALNLEKGLGLLQSMPEGQDMSGPSDVAIRSDLDIVLARSAAREVAKRLGFGAIDQARIATAVSELARNIFLYAGSGTVSVRPLERRGRPGIEIICEDQGPGIADIALVMQDGYSTSRGMGMGLPGAKRLMDEFELCSQVGVGTTVTCRKWRP